MINILDVFKKISENEGITITKLEQVLGASKGVLSRAINNNTDIQTKWLLRLVDNYPQYSKKWILTLKGEMLKGEETTPIINNQQQDIETSKLKELEKLLKAKEDTIESLKETNALLKDKIRTSNQAEDITKLKQEVKELKTEIGRESSVPRGAVDAPDRSRESKLEEEIGK
jgi:plasmid maintenance system antidote protein VapI